MSQNVEGLNANQVFQLYEIFIKNSTRGTFTRIIYSGFVRIFLGMIPLVTVKFQALVLFRAQIFGC